MPRGCVRGRAVSGVSRNSAVGAGGTQTKCTPPPPPPRHRTIAYLFRWEHLPPWQEDTCCWEIHQHSVTLHPPHSHPGITCLTRSQHCPSLRCPFCLECLLSCLCLSRLIADLYSSKKCPLQTKESGLLPCLSPSPGLPQHLRPGLPMWVLTSCFSHWTVSVLKPGPGSEEDLRQGVGGRLSG